MADPVPHRRMADVFLYALSAAFVYLFLPLWDTSLRQHLFFSLLWAQDSIPTSYWDLEHSSPFLTLRKFWAGDKASTSLPFSWPLSTNWTTGPSVHTAFLTTGFPWRSLHGKQQGLATCSPPPTLSAFYGFTV